MLSPPIPHTTSAPRAIPAKPHASLTSHPAAARIASGGPLRLQQGHVEEVGQERLAGFLCRISEPLDARRDLLKGHGAPPLSPLWRSGRRLVSALSNIYGRLMAGYP